jgi:protein SCO1/2
MGWASLAFAQSNFLREPVGRPSDQKDDTLKKVGVDQKLNAQLPLHLEFKDEQGSTVKLGDYFRTKPVIIAPVYYECPMLCSQILNGLVGSLRAVTFISGEDFEVVAVSFDPADTPETARKKKNTYVRRFGKPGAEEGWHFLTGSEANIKQLMDSMGYRYEFLPKIKQFAHASAVMVATPQGRLSRYLYGVEYAPRDVRLALVEASQGKIGNPVDSILLFCYHYDPATGKYSAAALNVIRLLGVALLLALGTFMFMSARRNPAPKAG